MAIAIILAAGDGKRLSSNKPKALMKYKNKPIIEYSLKEFAINKKIENIIVVIKKEFRKEYEKILKKYSRCFLVEGGPTRQISLNYAINFVKENLKYSNNKFIITHDCARININQFLINEHLKYQSLKTVAVSTILNCSDTLIRKNKNKFEFLDRNNIYLVQTPQSFTLNLWNIQQKNGTDLFSSIKIPFNKIKFVNGSNENFKITYKEDIKND